MRYIELKQHTDKQDKQKLLDTDNKGYQRERGGIVKGKRDHIPVTEDWTLGGGHAVQLRSVHLKPM